MSSGDSIDRPNGSHAMPKTTEPVSGSARPSGDVPWVIRHWVTQMEWRHVKGIAAIRVGVALWLVVLGITLDCYEFWWGTALFPLAGFVLWLAFQMPRWKLMLATEGAGSAGAARSH
jgi:hypothetical protein